MISGVDIEIETAGNDSAIEVATRLLTRFWPSAVIRDGRTGYTFKNIAEIPFGSVRELLVYRDDYIAKQWQREGAVPSLFNTMIYVIAEPGFLTVVASERDGFIDQVTSQIKASLRDGIFHSSATIGKVAA